MKTDDSSKETLSLSFDRMAALNSMAQLTSLMEQWDRESSSGSNPTCTLQKMADLVEKETEEWYKMDPDPFDDRHPGRADPNCALGHLLKTLFKNENFMNTLINTYLIGGSHRDDQELHTHGCRLLLDIMPGLEASVVFQDNEGLVRKLMNWAQTAHDPLKTYAIGLLGGAMELQDIAANYKESNATLVPSMLQKLHELMKACQNESIKVKEFLNRPFKDFGSAVQKANELSGSSHGGSGDARRQEEDEAVDDVDSPPTKKMRPNSRSTNVSWRGGDGFQINAQSLEDCSNSSWTDLSQYMIGTYSMWPLSIHMQQRLILQYLTSMAEYQEHLSHVFANDGMNLIFYYIDLSRNKDVRLAFESTKTLAALLCHKKFAVEFINIGGVEKLLDVHRPSVAATGASMCLYYLAYFEDTMERVCLLPHQVLANMVSYVLWLLECSHESGRSHASMFFGMAFPFRVILELFDRQDGLRKLYNVASTLQLFTSEGSDNAELTDDDVFTSRQTARHVCITLKKYFEAHLAIKADQLRRSHLRGEGGSTLADIPAYKPSKFPPEVIRDNIELLLECLPMRMRWDPVSEFIKLGGIQMLLQLVAMAAEWNAYTGKAETIRSALDVLTVCAVTPRVQLLLCDSVPIPENNTSSPAISIILGLAEGDILPDPEVQKASLNVLCNCVCSPSTRYSNSNIAKIVGGSAKKKNAVKKEEELLVKLWENVRTNNGIMVLLKLLTIKTPITEADSIRAFACKALVGLARCDTVKQIIGKLPLISSGQLQQLIKEPVLQDKRQEHLKFCKYSNELIEQVSGKTQSSHLDASLDKIRRADVVAQTKILYHEKELLQLLHGHLVSKGLKESADVLQKEANLPRSCPTPPPHHPPGIYATPTTPRMIRQLSTTPASSSRQAAIQNVPVTPSSSTSSTATPSGPIKINIISSKVSQSPVAANQARLQQSKRIISQKKDYPIASASTPILQKFPSDMTEGSMSLDKIVTEYLREQHALCHNPVVTCPTFSLLTPHRCPEPRHRSYAPANITSRLFQRSYFPSHGGPDGMKCNRKFVYSRFRPIRTYRDQDEDGCFSCCAFNSVEDCLILGTYAGEIKVLNISTSEEIGNFVVHNSPVTHCEPSRDGKFLLTGSTWGAPLSALWTMADQFEEKLTFEYDNYVEFSKLTQDMIIGTKQEVAHIYDVATGNRIRVLEDADRANNYTQNRATFSHTDDMVLNDGVLWDMSSSKPVHKFDKFNSNFSGVFHPMGMEVIINSEVWDLRTFKLLYTVPGLDQCRIRFNHAADVIYGAIHQLEDESEMDDATIKSPFGSSFRTFDGTDYSNIATIDVKKNIFDMCTDSSDCYLAVVENQRDEESLSEESVCRLYAVGRQRGHEDEEDDDDDNHEDDEEEGDDDGLDDDDDDDDDDLSGDDDDDDEEEDGESSNNQAENEDDDNNVENDNEDDGDAAEFEDSNEESDLDSEDSGDDEDIDNFLFELSDLSNF